MSTRSWIRALFPRPVSPVVRKGPPRARLSVEDLEDRAVPANFLVTSAADDGSTGTLRDAITQAQATSDGPDVITFDTAGVFATAQTTTLTTGQLDLTNTTGTLTIQGTG